MNANNNEKPSLFHQVTIDLHADDMFGKLVRHGKDEWQLEVKDTMTGTVKSTMLLGKEASAVMFLFVEGGEGFDECLVEIMYAIINGKFDTWPNANRPIP